MKHRECMEAHDKIEYVSVQNASAYDLVNDFMAYLSTRLFMHLKCDMIVRAVPQLRTIAPFVDDDKMRASRTDAWVDLSNTWMKCD